MILNENSPHQSHSGLERLGCRTTFQTGGWPSEPHLWRNRDFSGLLSPADIDHLLSDQGLRLPDFRLVKDGEPLASWRYTLAGRENQNASTADLVDPGRMAEEMLQGASLVMERLHRTWPPLRALCKEISHELNHPTQANGYLTPAEAQGFSPHHDTHDVFILQTYGAKEWTLYKPVFSDPLPQHSWKDLDRLTDGYGVTPAGLESYWTLRLEAGDCLWIPRGWPHEAAADTEPSLHATLGVLALTRHDLLRWLVELSAFSPALRQKLPCTLDAEVNIRDVINDVLSTWDEWVAESAPNAIEGPVKSRWLATLPGPTRYPVATALGLWGNIGPDTVFRVARESIYAIQMDDDTLILHLGDRCVYLPRRLESTMLSLASKRYIQDSDLASLSEEERTLLTKRLLEEGILTREDADKRNK